MVTDDTQPLFEADLVSDLVDARSMPILGLVALSASTDPGGTVLANAIRRVLSESSSDHEIVAGFGDGV